MGCSLPSTLAFDYPTVDRLLDYLAEQLLSEPSPAEPPPETRSISEAPGTEAEAGESGYRGGSGGPTRPKTGRSRRLIELGKSVVNSNSTANNQRLARALQAIEKLQARVTELQQASTEPIAIIGLGCRFPGGANSPAAFWQLLEQGVDAISPVPGDRWDADTYHDPNPETAGQNCHPLRRLCGSSPGV